MMQLDHRFSINFLQGPSCFDQMLKGQMLRTGLHLLPLTNWKGTQIMELTYLCLPDYESKKTWHTKKGHSMWAEQKWGDFVWDSWQIYYHWHSWITFIPLNWLSYHKIAKLCLKCARSAPKYLISCLNCQKMGYFGVGYWNRGKPGWGFARNKGVIDRYMMRVIRPIYFFLYQCSAAGHFYGRHGPDLARGPPFEKAWIRRSPIITWSKHDQ